MQPQHILVRSEVAGTVYEVLCAVEGSVAAGQDLLVIESMKMEVGVAAPVAGRVLRLLVAPGESVAADQPLVALEPAAT